MGQINADEVSEIFKLFMVKINSTDFDINNIGLHRDNSLSYIQAKKRQKRSTTALENNSPNYSKKINYNSKFNTTLRTLSTFTPLLTWK